MPSKPTFEKDIFISYSTKDSDFVVKLNEYLREFNLSVWQDTTDIKKGARIWEEIEKGLIKSQTVLAVISEDSLKSDWVQEELAIRRVQYIEDKSRALIPVLIKDLDENELPYRLKTLNWLDFRNLDYDNAVDFKKKTEELALSIKGLLPESHIDVITIPFVVLAMNNRQITEFWDESIFNTSPVTVATDLDKFRNLKKSLNQYDIKDLSPYYGDFTEDWKPIAANNVSIRDIIKESINLYNEQESERSGNLLLHPQFFSSDFFNDDVKWRNNTWRELNRIGSVIIIDSISLFHPDIREHFIQSGLGTSRSSSILVVSPYSHSSHPVNYFLEQEIRLRIQATFNRYDELDLRCECGAAETRTLKRWLMNILPKASIIVQSGSPNPDILKQVRKSVGKNKGGIDNVIF